MIHLDVISASDPLALGLYEFEYNYVYIGRSKKNDLIFLDKDIPAMYLKISIIDDGKGEHLIIKNNLNDPFFLINGKKISGSLKLKINDVISFAATKLKIINYKKNLNDLDISEAFDAFEANASECRVALDLIEEIIVDFEKQNNNV